MLRACTELSSSDCGVQGTATVTLAGVYGAMAVQGKEWKEITQQKVMMIGAGSAGSGIAAMLKEAMQKHVSCIAQT